jgi:hypothetical protein
MALLNKDPNQRLGAKDDAEEIKCHAVFKTINWQDILDKKVEA